MCIVYAKVAKQCSTGHMRSAGRSLPSPAPGPA